MSEISIIIPVYNVEEYVMECLDSVLKQQFDSYEVICVDDASTDGSAAIVDEYAKNNEKITLLHHTENLGLSAARNTGIQNAKGKYLLFVDSDDVIMPNTLEELYRTAEKNHTDIVYFNYKKIYESDRVLPQEERKWRDYQGIYSGLDFFSESVRNREVKVEAWRQFLRKEFLVEKNILFYEGILHEDNLFSFLCAMEADRITNVNKEYYLYRQRKDSIMSMISKKRTESLYIVCREVLRYWKEHDLADKVNEAIESYLGSMYREICYQREILSEENLQAAYADVEKQLTELQKGTVKKFATLSDDKIKLLKTAAHIIVFGAGRVAVDVLQLCMKENIKVDAIGVSSMEGNVQSIYGIQVHPMQELVGYKNTAYVVIGVSKKYYSRVREYLKNLGYCKLIAIDIVGK